MLVLLLQLAGLPAAETPAAAAQDTLGFRPLLSIPVTDTADHHQVPLGSRLVVRLEREVHANGTPMGWIVGVYHRPFQLTSRNLLYHSLRWHGPHPAYVFAWIHRQGLYPDDRVLPVSGWPYDLRVVCRDCSAEDDSTQAYFTAGVLAVGWRRLAHAHPPQQ